MTTTGEHSTMIAVFADHTQANQSIDSLRRAGFSHDQLRLVERGTHSFMENLKGLFAGPATTTTESADDWRRIGLPEQDAHIYQQELDTGRSIVLIKVVDNPEQSLSILLQNGAHDLAFRWRTAQPALAQETYNPDTAQGTADPNAPRRL
jgi:hypothetical protein